MCIKGTLIAKLKPGFWFFFFKCYLCIHFKKWVKSQREFSITFKKIQGAFYKYYFSDYKEFSTGSINWFIMTTPKHLGRLLYLWIWTDFSGNGQFQSWYLSSISFEDLTTKERYRNVF